MFEPYVTSKTKGTGLGLAIVKRMSDLLGLELDVASELEELKRKRKA